MLETIKAIALLIFIVAVLALRFYLVQGKCSTPAATDLKAKPPLARVIPKDVTVHGDERIDNYFWLREREDPEVMAYLKAENAYTETVMAPTKDLQERLFQEMKARVKETDLSVPFKIDDYYYYTRTEEGKQYAIHCRKKGSLSGVEEIILDVNALASGHSYMSVGAIKVSSDHRFLAYSTDTDGSEQFTVQVEDLATGTLFPERIPNAYYSLEWAGDNKTVFYNTLDEARRPYRLYRHVLGTDVKEDVLVYTEEDDAYYLSLQKSKSREYLFMVLKSAVTTEVRYLKAGEPQGEWRVIHPRRQSMEYYAEHHGERFFILTNDNAINFKLVEAPVASPTKENWREVVPHREQVKLEDIEVFRNHLVIFEREAGLSQIVVKNLSGGEEHRVEFPETVYAVYVGQNPDFNTAALRFIYTSLITPRSVYDYDMDGKTRELKKQDEVLGGYDPTQYESKRIFATAPDGVKVPVSLVYKKGTEQNGKNPLYLYGYGSYGYTVEPTFSSRRLTLLDRGFVYAIAHVRGGGAMGRKWYEDGKYLKKKNTFTDFIACAEHLIQNQYTSSDRLIIKGESAGGLLVGASINMRPDLFQVAVAEVPFVDVVNTMLDETIPLTVTEYEEWGNPNDRTYYDYIKSYSPYDNVEAKNYPHILITAGWNDPRVQYWEPAKWTARLRALKTGDNCLLLKTNLGTGHGGSSGRYDYLREVAFEYAFILQVLGRANK